MTNAEMAAEFWQSEQGQSTLAGLRLDRSLAYWVAHRPEYDSFGDDEWADWYAKHWDALKLEVLNAWPK